MQIHSCKDEKKLITKKLPLLVCVAMRAPYHPPYHPAQHPSWRRWLLQQPHRRRPQPLPEHNCLLDTSQRGAIQRPLVRIVALHVLTMECEAHEAFYVP
jgi:hypothetical protein